jgi:hypothetical protein
MNSPIRVRFLSLFLVVPALALGAIGCGDEDRPPSGKVTGTVTYKGAPLPGGSVTFFDANNLKSGERSTATIDQEGHYVMPTAPLGNVKVIVTGPTPSSDPSHRNDRIVQIPLKYADVMQTGLVTTVSTGTQEFNIDLK